MIQRLEAMMLHQPRVYHKENLPSPPILVSTLEFLKAFASFLSTLVKAEEVAVVTGTLSVWRADPRRGALAHRDRHP